MLIYWLLWFCDKSVLLTSDVILILLQPAEALVAPFDVRLKSAKKFYFKQFSFAFV